MADNKINLRRDNPSPEALDGWFAIMAAIMPGGLCLRNTFFEAAAGRISLCWVSPINPNPNPNLNLNPFA
jgi:hypothetical protein